MINCLQDELIKVRLREAENEESIRNLGEKVSELEEVSDDAAFVCLFINIFIHRRKRNFERPCRTITLLVSRKSWRRPS